MKNVNLQQLFNHSFMNFLTTVIPKDTSDANLKTTNILKTNHHTVVAKYILHWHALH